MAPPEGASDWSSANIVSKKKLVEPLDAGFNGHISLGNYVLTLPRGSEGLASIPAHWENRLLWHTPKDGTPELIFVNKDGQKYVCNFTPID